MSNKKPIVHNTLIYAIAKGSTGDARNLLKKYSGKDARNIRDLEFKLAEFYKNSDDKPTLEKELANIHPHKDFILKYLAPVTPIDVPLAADTTTANEKVLGSKSVLVHDGYSNANGYSNCEGCGGKCQEVQKMSGFDGGSNATGGNNAIMVLGIVSIVAMFSLVLINNNKK